MQRSSHVLRMYIAQTQLCCCFMVVCNTHRVRRAGCALLHQARVGLCVSKIELAAVNCPQELSDPEFSVKGLVHSLVWCHKGDTMPHPGKTVAESYAYMHKQSANLVNSCAPSIASLQGGQLHKLCVGMDTCTAQSARLWCITLVCHTQADMPCMHATPKPTCSSK